MSIPHARVIGLYNRVAAAPSVAATDAAIARLVGRRPRAPYAAVLTGANLAMQSGRERTFESIHHILAYELTPATQRAVGARWTHRGREQVVSLQHVIGVARLADAYLHGRPTAPVCPSEARRPGCPARPENCE